MCLEETIIISTLAKAGRQLICSFKQSTLVSDLDGWYNTIKNKTNGIKHGQATKPTRRVTQANLEKEAQSTKQVTRH